MKPRTVILGAGFAGLQACKALRGAQTDLVVIDPSPVTTMLPALPDLAGGWIPERLTRYPVADLLPPNATHLQASATSIDLDQRRVAAGGETLSYDYLLIASGSVPRPAEAGFPKEQLHPLASLPDALRIQTEFSAYLRETERPHLLVAGAGYTGLELAMSLFFRARAAGKTCDVTIVDPAPQLLPSLPDAQRKYVLDFLSGQGAEVRLDVAIESFDGRNAVAGGRTYENVFFCWAAGSVFAVPEIRGDVVRLRDGRLKVARDLSLPRHPNVFAAGDSAAIEQRGQILRKAVNFAFYGGTRAGRNIARRLRGKSTRPFRPVDLGWVVPFHATSLGRLPGGLWVRGPLGVRLHHLMCGIRSPSLENFAGCLKLAWKGTNT